MSPISINSKHPFNQIQTSFTSKHPQIQHHSAHKHIYQILLQPTKPPPTFIFHHPPPYPNPHIHIPHPLNKILKHFILPFKSINPYHPPYLP
ncbi:class I tRNA ligase family protein, partial [Bacillus sp. WP8]|uniref:class I tRNA ligase family protein n=1 Tax=Bacillus sp. WP8 TaxID=756828 RepID=UPI0037BE9120